MLRATNKEVLNKIKKKRQNMKTKRDKMIGYIFMTLRIIKNYCKRVLYDDKGNNELHRIKIEGYKF